MKVEKPLRGQQAINGSESQSPVETVETLTKSIPTLHLTNQSILQCETFQLPSSRLSNTVQNCQVKTWAAIQIKSKTAKKWPRTQNTYIDVLNRLQHTNQTYNANLIHASTYALAEFMPARNCFCPLFAIQFALMVAL